MRAGDLASIHRNRQKSKNVDAMLFLNKNMYLISNTSRKKLHCTLILLVLKTIIPDCEVL